MSEIPLNDNWVFLLGAGYARSFNCPVMNDFMERARNRYFILKAENGDPELIECHLALLNFQSACLRTAWIFTRNWDNIEELYTQADLLRLSGDPEAEKLCRQIAWAIWDIYRKPYVSGSSHLKDVCTRLKRMEYKPVIITTNYDTSIEQQLGAPPDYWYPGFRYEPTKSVFSVSEPKRRENGIPVIKLHGSTNWFQFPDDTWLALHYDHQFDYKGDGTHLCQLRNNLADLAETKMAKTESDRIQPAIVPPMLGKATHSTVLQKQWSAAIRALALARQVWVVGYSFPPTDLFMLRLLSAGLGNNQNLQKLVICDYQLLPEWTDRLRGMFAPKMLDHRFQYCAVDSKNLFSFLAGSDNANVPTYQWANAVTEQLCIAHVDKLLRERRASMG